MWLTRMALLLGVYEARELPVLHVSDGILRELHHEGRVSAAAQAEGPVRGLPADREHDRAERDHQLGRGNDELMFSLPVDIVRL